MKKLQAVLLAVCLVLALVPFSAVAQDVVFTDWTETDSLPTSGAYKLTENVTLVTSFSDTYSVKGELILDLNGKTVTITKDAFDSITVPKGSSLKIVDNSEEKTGKITNGSNASSINTLIYANGGSFELAGGTLESVGGGKVVYINGSTGVGTISGGSIINASPRSGYALFVNAGANATVSGGDIINNASNGYAVQINGEETSFTLTGGTVKNTVNGSHSLFVNGGSFTLDGGTVIQESTYSSSAAVYANNSGKAINIISGSIRSSSTGVYAAFTPVSVTGGTITADSHAFQTRYATIDPAEGSTVDITAGKSILYLFRSSDNVINGGNFDAQSIVSVYSNDEPEDTPTVTTITGGLYSISPVDYIGADEVAALYTPADGEPVYAVGKDVADIAASAESGDTIDVIAGSINLSVSNDGVFVNNSGEGNVSVNGDPVPEGGLETHIHKYSAEYSFDNASHWFECECGAKAYLEAHTMSDWTIDKEATCTEDGSRSRKCECGYSEIESIPATGHKNVTKTDAVSATCTIDGNIEYWYCADCQKYFSNSSLTREISPENTEIKASGHKITAVEGKDATETENGNIPYWYCEKCNTYFADEALTQEITYYDTIIPATGSESQPDESQPDESQPDESKPDDSSAAGDSSAPAASSDADSSQTPDTGDTTLVTMMVLLIAVAAAAMTVVVCRRRKSSI